MIMEEKRARIYYKVFNPCIEKVNSMNTIKFLIALLDKVEENTGRILLPPAYKKEVCRNKRRIFFEMHEKTRRC